MFFSLVRCKSTATIYCGLGSFCRFCTLCETIGARLKRMAPKESFYLLLLLICRAVCRNTSNAHSHRGLTIFQQLKDLNPSLRSRRKTKPRPQPKECLTGKAFDAAMAKGYNDAGLSVQLPASWMSDRDIFRRTVLRGKMEVTYGDLSLRKTETLDDGKKKKVAVSKDTWEQVVKAALALYPIGKLEAAGTSKSKLVFSQVPTQNAKRVAFHNMLVDSCQVSVRQWCDSLQKETDRVASRKRKQGETTEKPGDDD